MTDMVPMWTDEDVDNLARRVKADPVDNLLDIEDAVLRILTAAGEDVDRPGIKETPGRVARMYVNELLSGYRVDVRAIVKTFANDGYEQVVAVKDIPFYSLCEHHMLPFKGMVHIGYLPDGRVLGLSKFARIVDAVAARLQIQERMTKEIADVIQEGLQPKGVMVVIEAEHLCMTMRGTKKPSSTMVTSMVTGVFEQDASTKDEFLRLIGR